ncbi:MAG TPA: DUF6538 domain-containing protein [Nitrospiraceae bacterium]|nr:DUF6538 domain-containing protein [Nitrospiraceae bacterium]
MPHIFKRRHVYSVRFLVPIRLRDILHRKDIWRSLRTRSYAVAKMRAGIMSGHVATLSTQIETENPALSIPISRPPGARA